MPGPNTKNASHDYDESPAGTMMHLHQDLSLQGQEIQPPQSWFVDLEGSDYGDLDSLYDYEDYSEEYPHMASPTYYSDSDEEYGLSDNEGLDDYDKDLSYAKNYPSDYAAAPEFKNEDEIRDYAKWTGLLDDIEYRAGKRIQQHQQKDMMQKDIETAGRLSSAMYESRARQEQAFREKSTPSVSDAFLKAGQRFQHEAEVRKHFQAQGQFSSEKFAHRAELEAAFRANRNQAVSDEFVTEGQKSASYYQFLADYASLEIDYHKAYDEFSALKDTVSGLDQAYKDRKAKDYQKTGTAKAWLMFKTPTPSASRLEAIKAIQAVASKHELRERLEEGAPYSTIEDELHRLDAGIVLMKEAAIDALDKVKAEYPLTKDEGTAAFYNRLGAENSALYNVLNDSFGDMVLSSDEKAWADKLRKAEKIDMDDRDFDMERGGIAYTISV